MFWNKKRKQKEPETMTAPAEPEPDISEPIKSFLDASHRWMTELRLEGGECSGNPLSEVMVVTDTGTGLSLELSKYWNPLSDDGAGCHNHDWITRDEARAVFSEAANIHGKALDEARLVQRQEWVDAYQNLSTN